MDLTGEASAIIVRLGTSTANADVRPLALRLPLTRLFLKSEADLLLVEPFVKVVAKPDREFHNLLEILGTTGLRRRTSFAISFSSPAIVAFFPSFRALSGCGRSWESEERSTSDRI